MGSDSVGASFPRVVPVGSAGRSVVPPPDVPAVFLDRDGTLVRDYRHAADPDALALLPGVGDALAILQQAGYVLVVVANQSGVARGCFSLAEAEAMRPRLGTLVADHGVQLDGYYFCPHFEDGEPGEHSVACVCRKPAPGLLYWAAADLGLALHRSWIVGDRLSDAHAGWAAGCRAVLVDIGGQGVPPGAALPPVARNLPHAAKMILAADGWLEDRQVCPEKPDALVARGGEADERADGDRSPWPKEEHGLRAEAEAAELAGWCRAPSRGVRHQ